MDRESTPVAVRLARLGHADTRMIMNYSHVISQDDRKVAEGIANVVALSCAEDEKGLKDARPYNPIAAMRYGCGGWI